jgi:hypothetical protein
MSLIPCPYCGAMVADQDFGTCPKCGGDYIGSAEAARRQAAADRMTAEEAAQAKAEAEAERKFYEDQKKDKKSNIFLYIPFWGGLLELVYISC